MTRNDDMNVILTPVCVGVVGAGCCVKRSRVVEIHQTVYTRDTTAGM